MLERIRALAPVWHRVLRRRRRVLALLTLTALLATVLPAMLPPSARGVEILVAAHDLPAGTVLEAADLRTVRVAAALVPDGALHSPSQAGGRTVMRDVAARTPVLPAHLDQAASGVDVRGRSRMVLPVDAALLPCLDPGTGLRLILSGSDPTRLHTVDAQVLDMSAASSGSTPGIPSAPESVPVVVAVDPADAGSVSQALREGWVNVTVID